MFLRFNIFVFLAHIFYRTGMLNAALKQHQTTAAGSASQPFTNGAASGPTHKDNVNHHITQSPHHSVFTLP